MGYGPLPTPYWPPLPRVRELKGLLEGRGGLARIVDEPSLNLSRESAYSGATRGTPNPEP